MRALDPVYDIVPSAAAAAGGLSLGWHVAANAAYSPMDSGFCALLLGGVYGLMAFMSRDAIRTAVSNASNAFGDTKHYWIKPTSEHGWVDRDYLGSEVKYGERASPGLAATNFACTMGCFIAVAGLVSLAYLGTTAKDDVFMPFICAGATVPTLGGFLGCLKQRQQTRYRLAVSP